MTQPNGNQVNDGDISIEHLIRGAFGQGEGKPVNKEELEKLIATLQTFDVKDPEHRDANEVLELLNAAKQENGGYDEMMIQNLLGPFLSDGEHVTEIAETIGTFEIRF